MAFDAIHPDLVRFEMRVVQGQDPHVREQRKTGGFGRFLSGIGKVFGAIAAPLSFIFPPAALASAAMYGVSAIGDQSQARAYARAANKQQREGTTQVSFPGLDVSSANAQPASFDLSAKESDTMKLLGIRGNAASSMSRSI